MAADIAAFLIPLSVIFASKKLYFMSCTSKFKFGIFYYNIIPNTEFVNLFIGVLVPYLALFC